MSVYVRRPFSVGLVSLCASIGALAFTTPPALAAAPETPEVTAESVTTMTATFHGILNPAAPEQTKAGTGTYKFLYKASKTECTGAGGKETSPSGLSLGGPHEEVFEPVTGLTQNTEYMVCLSVTNLEGQTTASAPAPFTTKDAPVTSSPAKAVTSTTATLEGTLNPGTEAETGYYFAYSTNGLCTEGSTSPAVEAKTNGKVKAQKVTAPLSGLEPNTTYTFCLVATNVQGEATAGNAVSFKTKVLKPTVISLSAAPKAEEAHLEAVVNPSNEATECHFQYGETSVSEHTIACEQGSPPGTLEGGEQGVGVNAAGLKPNTTYHYKVLLKNATGETTEEATFTAAIHPETSTGLKAEAITPTTVTLTGVLNPKEVGDAGTYEFVYRPSGKSPSECQGAGETTSSQEPATGAKEEPAKATLTGLNPNTQYTACLRAHNAAGEESTLTSPITFTTLVAPLTIESESSTVVSATEARLEASIYDGNSEATYHFEYGTSAGSYDVSVPGISAHIPAGLTAKSVNAAAIGLSPGTTYHYRVVASNALPGEVDGPDREFTTPAAQTSGSPTGCPNEHLRAEQPFGLTLPDCRAYEMVSPTDTYGQDATSAFAQSVARASEAPAGTEPAITYTAKGSFGEPHGGLINSQYLSRRSPEGWSTRAISPLAAPGSVEGHATEPFEGSYPGTVFTAELTSGLTVSTATLAEGTPQLNGLYGVYSAQFAGGAYRYVGATAFPYVPWGASPDLSRVLLTDSENFSLLESVDGTNVPVSVENGNNGEPIVASAGSAQYFAAEKDAWHAMSEDGSRVFFTSPVTEAEVGQLYVRVNIGVKAEPKQSELNAEKECTEPAKECTIEVSASQREPEDPAGPQPARYWGASADGAKVFFTSRSELTQNAYTGEGDSAPNLYEYDVETGILTDLTVDQEDLAEGAAVQGVAQISEDGSYVYYVAKGALRGAHSETLHNAAGAAPVQAEDNLYVSHLGGAPVFIATLAAKDETDWLTGGPTAAGPEVNTAVLSPAGSQLAFISERSLPTASFPAGYDNKQAEAGKCETELENHEKESGMCREVFVYHAPTNLATESGTLVCASCNPAGARPVGPASIPGVVPRYEMFGDYRPRDFLADGTLFFDSSDALVPHASNGLQNVYEYEDGEVHAISNAAGGYESFFLDASPDGENVFFASADKLLPEDPGGNTAVWDARIDGGFPVVTSPPSCDNADSCKAPESPQPGVFAAPSSSTFSGPGNTTPPAPAVAKKVTKKTVICKKGFVKKKVKKKEACVKKKSKKKAKRATNDRRTGR